MKKVFKKIGILLVLLLLLLLNYKKNVYGAAEARGIQLGDASVINNGTTELQIASIPVNLINDFSNINNINFCISFDDANIHFVDILPGDLPISIGSSTDLNLAISPNMIFYQVNAQTEPGKIYISTASVNFFDAVQNGITLFLIRFQVSSYTPPGEYQIHIEQTILHNSAAGYEPPIPIPITFGLDPNAFSDQGQDYPCTLSGGTLMVKTLSAPLIDSIDPNCGQEQGHTEVTINGSFFQDETSIFFGQVEAIDVTMIDATKIICLSPPASPGTGWVNISATDGSGGTFTLQNAFHYLPPPPSPPVINSLVPSRGYETGGTLVTIYGSGFQNGALVFFGNVNATITFINPNTIICKSPGGIGNNLIDIRIINQDGQTITLMNAFEYIPAPPEIHYIDPNYGPERGNSKLDIYGKNFQQGLKVSVGGTWANEHQITFINQNHIQCIIPSGRGCVNITVMNPDNELVVVDNAFTFIPPPVLSDIIFVDQNNHYGSIRGGEQIIIRGMHFIPGNTVVKFGNTFLDANDIAVKDSSTILCTTPPSTTPGPVDIKVIVWDDLQATLSDGFLYRFPQVTYTGKIIEAIGNGGTISFFWHNRHIQTEHIDRFSGVFSLQLTDPNYLHPNHFDISLIIDHYEPKMIQWGEMYGLELTYAGAMYHVKGRVKDYEGAGVSGAEVFLVNIPGKKTFTDAEGFYILYLTTNEWDGQKKLNAAAIAANYISSDPIDISQYSDFILLKNTTILTSIKPETYTLSIQAVPQFSGNLNEMKAYNLSTSLTLSEEITDSFRYTDATWKYTYPYPSDMIKLLIMADTTEDKSSSTGYKAEKKIIYYMQENIQRYSVSYKIKKAAGGMLEIPSIKGENMSKAGILIPPQSINQDGALHISVIDPKEIVKIDNPLLENLTNCSETIIKIELQDTTLQTNGYIEISMPFISFAILDSDVTPINLEDPNNELNAFKKNRINIFRFEDEDDLNQAIADVLPVNQIINTFSDGTGAQYVTFRAERLSLFTIGTGNTSEQNDSDDVDLVSKNKSGCFIGLFSIKP